MLTDATGCQCTFSLLAMPTLVLLYTVDRIRLCSLVFCLPASMRQPSVEQGCARLHRDARTKVDTKLNGWERAQRPDALFAELDREDTAANPDVEHEVLFTTLAIWRVFDVIRAYCVLVEYGRHFSSGRRVIH